MAFSPFTYYQRGRPVTAFKNSKPKSYQGPLVKYQIEQGCYEESHYWEMAKEEEEMFRKEVEEFKKENPNADEHDVRERLISRKRQYDLRISKLKEEHLNYETSRLAKLREGLINHYCIDVWEEALELCDGGAKELFDVYGLIVRNRHLADTKPF